MTGMIIFMLTKFLLSINSIVQNLENLILWLMIYFVIKIFIIQIHDQLEIF